MHTPQSSVSRMIEPCDSQQSQSQVSQTSLLSLFRFTKPYDVLLMVIGSIAACLIGASLPLFCLFYGDMVNTFTNLDSMLDQATRVFRSFIYLGVGALVTGWIMMLFWTMAGERQSNQCRKQYFKSLLNQQIAWFDTNNQSEMATQFSVNTHIYRSALGQKMPILLMIISMFFTGVIIAFVKGWLMTLIVLVSIPFVIFGWYLYSKACKIRNNKLQKLYEEGGSKVQQALSCIKVIKQLNGQLHQIASYSNLLDQAIEKTLKYRIYAGIGSGLSFTFILLAFTLAMWYGSRCVQGSSLCPASLNNGNSSYTPGVILVIFYGLLFPAVNLSQLTPAIQKIIEGKQASSKIFHIIDRKPTIISPINPKQINNFKGNFKFQNVTFAYPKDKFKKILENMSFQINCSNSAFIGESGCGKSTIFQLMMRLYDPEEGVITLDGINLRQLDLCWLRSQIGYVGQEPVLFATTIRQNLLIGKSNAKETELQDVLRKAQALDFVNDFSEKLETYVGTDGSQLSGGQKQRIAIARALLKDPKILLLDQATSALDRHNQKLIQNTLNSISQNRISITITHHLKTIEKCQAIFRVEKGQIAQEKRNYINRKVESQMNCIDDIFQNKDEKAVMENEDNNNIYPIEGRLQKQKQNDQDAIKKSDLQKEDGTYQRLFSFIDNKLIFGVGILLAIIGGVIFPLFGIFLSRIIVTLIQYYGNSISSLADSNIYLIIMLLISIIAFPICFFHEIIFTKVGEQITLDLRKKAFQKIIKMPIPWFEKKENNCGDIAASLQKDCLIVNGIFSTYMPHLIINISTLIFGIILALVYEWRTALVALGLLPLIIISQVVQMAYSNNLIQNTDKSLKQSAGFIKEAIDNIRTVKSLANQSLLLQKYSQKLQATLKQSIKKGHITGLLFGFSYFVMFIVFALIFYLGAVFIRHYNVQVLNMFTAVYLIIFAGIAVGNNGSQMPDLAQARHAASNIFQILDGEDEDQLQTKKGSLNLKSPIKGNISLQNISFKYENRQELALNNINLDIKEGEKVGLVGKSGSGKSTIIQLLLGFYPPTAGKILIDGINMTDYDIHHLRANFGVVSQEPILFNQTIEYNIKYNKEHLTKEDIVAAANQANFNPDKEYIEEQQSDKSFRRIRGMGFNQNVGHKGTHISGGQKQRVAIARIIIRQPSILLLDQATSALDESNQRKVRDSLNRLMSNKTCITVTHRMQTVKNATQIVVLENGRVVEMGLYDQLTKQNGFFSQFLRTSNSPTK